MSEENILICGPNWLGDSIMCMPALQAMRAANPDMRLTMLVKPQNEALWAMHPDIDEIAVLESGMRGALRSARRLPGPDRAYVFPNSFRSALVPLLARVPERVGYRGHRPGWMLTRVVEQRKAGAHQAWEYMEILGLSDGGEALPAPRLDIDIEDARRLSGVDGRAVGILPGAAYGPSKRWPSGHFAEAGRALIERTGCHVLVFGTAGEAELCRRVATQVGDKAADFSGRTTIPQLAGLLGMCDVVIANDSGGMHLAAAAGTRVVAVFGVTDPVKTGPLGDGHRLLFRKDVQHSRDLKRVSAEARQVLTSITPDQVVDAALAVMGEQGST